MSDDERRRGDDEPLVAEAPDDEEERLQRELDVWAFFGGRAPSSVASTLDTLRGALPPATARDRQRASQRFFDGLEERLSRRGPPPAELLDLAGLEDIDHEDDDDEHEHDAIAPPVHASSAAAVSTSAPTVPWPHAEAPRGTPIAPNPPPATPNLEAPESATAAVRKPPPAWVATTPSMDLAPEARALFAARSSDASRPAPIAVVSAPKGFGHTLPLENPVAEIAAAVKAGAYAGASPSIKKEENPRVGEGIAAAVVVGAPEPEAWTVERYASLSVELSLDPDRAAVLERYQVRNEVTLAALVEHWNDRMAREPGLKAAMDAAKIRYTVWWSANRMGKGP